MAFLIFIMRLNLKELKIGVLGGGISPEREISMKSSAEVVKSFERQGYNHIFVEIIGTDKMMIKKILQENKVDLAFIVLHGEFGEDGTLQQYLAEYGLPYTGSGPLASHLAMNKITSKLIFNSNDIATPKFSVWTRVKKTPTINSFPVVIKPYFGGSSFGVTVVFNDAEVGKALECALEYSNKVIIEEYIHGRELTVGILGDKVLDIVEIFPANGKHFDYNSKYVKDGAIFKVPADLGSEVIAKTKETALLAHNALNCKDFSRVDILLDDDTKVPYVLEINAVPGLTENSLLPLSAKSAGIEFDDLTVKIAELALYG